MKAQVLTVIVALIVAVPLVARGVELTVASDITTVEKAIHASIRWALTRNRALLESLLSHDPSFLIYHPDSKTYEGLNIETQLPRTTMNFRTRRNHQTSARAAKKGTR